MEIPSDFEYQGEIYSPLPNKFPSFQELDHYTSFSQFEVLINWVNSFEYPNCLLASKVDDFKDGIIFCELVNELILKNQIPDFLPKIVSHDPTHEEKLHNITMALSEIKSMRTISIPIEIKGITIFDLMQDDTKIITLVKFLNDFANDKFPLVSSNKNAPRNSAPNDFKKNAFEHQPKFISDSFQNRSDTFSNNSSTQPSPMANFPGSKPPHKPPLNPPQSKQKPVGQPPLPSNHNQFKKPAFNQAPMQAEEPAYPYEQHRAETFSSVEAPHQKMHSPSPHEYKSFEYNHILGASPQQNAHNKNERKHQTQEDFYSPFFTAGTQFNETEIEVLKSMNPYDEDLHREKSYRNSSKLMGSGSKYDHSQQQQQSLFSTPTNNRQERIDYETFSPDHERAGRRIIGEVPSYSFVVPEAQQQRHTEKRAPPVRGNYMHSEQNETRIVPMEVQRKSFSHQKPNRESYDYEGLEGPQHQSIDYQRPPAYHPPRSKNRSELPHPAPEILEVRPESHNTTEKRASSSLNTTRKKEEKEIVITEVSDETKRKIVNWLCQIGLLKENIRGIEEKLPKVCKNGLVFIDLVNRLEGRNEAIKGINRNSKSKSQINTNYLKVLDYLKGFEKMNPRYLAAGDYLIDGQEEVFWGFLDDIWHLYNKKIAPTDPRYKVPKEKVKARSNKPPISQRENVKPTEVSRNDISYNDICTMQNTPSHSLTTTGGMQSPAAAPNRGKDRSFEHGILKNSKKNVEQLFDNSSITYNNGNDSSHYKEEDLSQILPRNSVTYKEPLGEHNPRNENKKMQIRTDSMPTSPKKKLTAAGISMTETATPTKRGTTPKNTSSISRNSPSYAKRSETPLVQDTISLTNEEQTMSIDIEILVNDWLKQMGYKALLMRERGSLFDDPFRNGTLLCYLLGRVENERMHGMYKEPKTIEECRLNVSKAFQIMKRKHVPIPSFINGREESVLRGDRHVTLTLLYTLMKLHKNRTENTGIPTLEGETPKYEASGYIPPYSELEMEELEKSLITWISNLGLLHGLTYQPASIRELMSQIKNGVLLCDLVAVVVNEKMGTIHRRPSTELQFLTNIRKALEMLRMQKNFGQKYLWKEKEICKGNKYIVVGLLEDMHRFYNDLPARRNPKYFGEGPYLATNNTQNTRAQMEDDDIRFRNTTYEQSQPTISNFGRMSVGGMSEKSAGYMGILKSPTHTAHYTSNLYDEAPQERNSALNISSDAPISLMTYVKKPDQSSRDTGRKSVQFEGVNRTGRDSTYRSPQSKTPGSNLLNSNARPTTTTFGSFVNNAPRSPLGRNTIEDNYEIRNPQDSSIERGYLDQGSLLKEWIISMGLSDLVRLTDFNAKFIPDMKDGIILCKIIERLEMREIPGVILKPHTNASRMVNIRKCLNTLSKRPGVNPHSLHCEDRIVAGDGDTIRRILTSIKEAYKFANRCINRSSSRSRSSSRVLDASAIADQKSYYNATPVYDERPSTTMDSYNRTASDRKRMLIPSSGRKGA